MAGAMSRSKAGRLSERVRDALPRRWGEHLRAIRRDVAMIRDGITGTAPPHLIPRPERSTRGAARDLRSVITFESMRVVDIIRETPDASTLVLTRADGSVLEFTAGQFLTVEVELSGAQHRRAYSLSSAPSDGRASITIKRIPGGRVSTHLNEEIEVGSLLRVRGPSGSFASPPTDGPRHLIMLAGGSGITPLFSIAREVLRTEPETRITLAYGNRSADDIIFARALDEMAADEARFDLVTVLSDPPDDFGGVTGILDRKTVEERLDALERNDGAEDETTAFLICGPAPMRAACREALEARGVASAQIREEIFVRPEIQSDAMALPTENVTVRMTVGNEARDVIVAPGQTLLEAGLSVGTRLPYSCTMGGCAVCRVQLTSGEVQMEEPNCLTADERERGFILACVTRPLGPCAVRVERT